MAIFLSVQLTHTIVGIVGISCNIVIAHFGSTIIRNDNLTFVNLSHSILVDNHSGSIFVLGLRFLLYLAHKSLIETFVDFLPELLHPGHLMALLMQFRVHPIHHVHCDYRLQEYL